MNTIIKSTVRNEIQHYMLNSVGGSDPSDEPLSKPKKRKTEGRLNKLLNRIRSSTISKTGDKAHKVKKFQLKYERYDHINEVLKKVRVKDGGGPHFIDVATSL